MIFAVFVRLSKSDLLDVLTIYIVNAVANSSIVI